MARGEHLTDLRKLKIKHEAQRKAALDKLENQVDDDGYYWHRHSEVLGDEEADRKEKEINAHLRPGYGWGWRH